MMSYLPFGVISREKKQRKKTWQIWAHNRSYKTDGTARTMIDALIMGKTTKINQVLFRSNQIKQWFWMSKENKGIWRENRQVHSIRSVLSGKHIVKLYAHAHVVLSRVSCRFTCNPLLHFSKALNPKMDFVRWNSVLINFAKTFCWTHQKNFIAIILQKDNEFDPRILTLKACKRQDTAKHWEY